MQIVTIIIPNYNGKHFMEPCLASLEKQTCRDFKILVVDNASTDGSLEFLEDWKATPNLEVLALDKNYGFSGAVNIGIKHADTPYVLLLNNDTTVDAHFVEEMISAISESPRIFSVSSKMIQMYHPELIDSAGDLYTLMGWAACRGTGRSVENYPVSDEIFSACAGAAIYRRKVFEKIGYFDERHFAYLEDVDVGYRAKLYGYRNKYCPSAIVYHVGSGTSGSKYNAFKVRLSARNNVWVCHKNMATPQLILNAPFLIAGHIVKSLFFIKIGFGKEYLAGLWEGITTARELEKVQIEPAKRYRFVKIELELIGNTITYVKDWVSRKVLEK